MNRIDKLKKLDHVKETLKSEFFGIDEIIDNVCRSITPWYITPELIERPVIISIMGLTGTGKTSLIRRLTELLDLSKNTIFFDCGEESDADSTSRSGVESGIVDKIIGILGISDNGVNEVSNKELDNLIFVFDEFQYAKTLDESGNEVIKPSIRPIWNIIDYGKLNINSYDYTLLDFTEFIEDLQGFIEMDRSNSSIPVSSGVITGAEDVKKVLLSFGLTAYDRDVSSLVDLNSIPVLPIKDTKKNRSNNDEEEDILRPLTILTDRYKRIMNRKLVRLVDAETRVRLVSDLYSSKTVGEFCDVLLEIKSLIVGQKSLNFPRSLIFVIGNIDEAYENIITEMSPDIDADSFRERTKSVTISDMKTALSTRFRAEQIARLGNNMILYPSLRKVDFESIIQNEISRTVDRFRKISGIENVKIGHEINRLLYSEGVYPSQGARPLFTTINAFFTPLLSDIITCNEGNNVEEVYIGVQGEGTGEVFFNVPKIYIKIDITYVDGKTDNIKKLINLQLGELRDPEKRKLRYCMATHEIGHAIVYLHETGNYPANIVATSSGNGGFCETYNKDSSSEIDTRDEIDSEVRILLAGYRAECLAFGNRTEKCLMGSGSDIESAWSVFSNAAYNTGYYFPVKYANPETSCRSSDGITLGMSDSRIQEYIERDFARLEDDVCKILKKEKTLLKIASIELGRVGSMSSERFKELSKKYGNVVGDEKFLQKVRDERSGSWYLGELEKL